MTDIDTIEPDGLPEPETVRTPGKTWTEFPDDLPETGTGTVAVHASGDTEVARAAPGDLPDWAADAFGTIDPSTDRITGKHAAALHEVTCIRVPAGAAEEVVVAADGTAGLFPHHVVVVVEDGASASLVDRTGGDAALATTILEAVIGDDAVLDATLVNGMDAGTGYTACHAAAGEDATVSWTIAAVGADRYRNHVTTHLTGPRSTLDYNLGFLAAGDQHMDMTTHVIHGADNTRCDMDSRGIAMEQARAVYKGVQEVTQDAEGTSSFQDEKTVLIGSEAEADTTPQLQIDNSDVEATHAATTGHIDEQDLFYMQSRGLSDTAAKREIITGMFDDLIGSNAVGADAIHAKIGRTLGDR